VLGLIFLRYDDVKFGQVYNELKAQSEQQSSRRARQLRLFEQPARRREHRPEDQRGHAPDRGENPQLKGVLPQSYQHLENPTLSTLLKVFNNIPMDIEGDAFGEIFEYFPGQFDIVMANPPFNVNHMAKDRIKNDATLRQTRDLLLS